MKKRMKKGVAMVCEAIVLVDGLGNHQSSPSDIIDWTDLLIFIQD
jgi:hypothetical protein